MNTLTITLPEELYQRVEKRAVERGETIESLVKELVEQGLEEPRKVSPATRLLRQRLHEARAEVEAGGGHFLTWDEVESEVATRRGGIGDLPGDEG
jgi:predicted DNA-binding protein